MLLITITIVVAIPSSNAEISGTKYNEQICQCEPHPISFNEEFLSNNFTDEAFFREHCSSMLSSLSCITNSLDTCQSKNSGYNKSNYGFMNGIYAIMNNLCHKFSKENSRSQDETSSFSCEIENYDKCKSTASLRSELEDKFLPSEAFLVEHCSSLLDSISCIKNYLNTCGDDILKGSDYNMQIVALTEELLKDLCNANSNLRKVYSHNVECVNTYKDNYYNCISNASRGAEGFKNYLMEINYENKEDISTLFKCLRDAMKATCIIYETIEKCGSGILEAIETIQEYFTNGIEDTLCPSQIIQAAMDDYRRYVDKNPDPIYRFGFDTIKSDE